MIILVKDKICFSFPRSCDKVAEGGGIFSDIYLCVSDESQGCMCLMAIVRPTTLHIGKIRSPRSKENCPRLWCSLQGLPIGTGLGNMCRSEKNPEYRSVSPFPLTLPFPLCSGQWATGGAPGPTPPSATRLCRTYNILHFPTKI